MVRHVMASRKAAWSAAAACGGLMLGLQPALADCGWDIRMTTAEIAEVESTVVLAQNPDLPLGPGVELPPQQRSTTGGTPAPEVVGGKLVSGATPAGQEVVPDEAALTGRAMEGSVPGPAEEPIAKSRQPEGGLMDAPSEDNDAAEQVARAKLKVRDAQKSLDRGDREACYEAIDEAMDLVSQSRRAIVAAAKGAVAVPETPGGETPGMQQK